MTKILLKTTIPFDENDWHTGRFLLLVDHLRRLGCEVAARNREADAGGDDLDLRALAASPTDQLWLFALEVGGGLTPADCAAIEAFRARGGGVLLTRDHQDMGTSLLGLGELGAAHHFHSRNLELDEARRCCDDVVTTDISWPNYHSGANGDFFEIAAAEPRHPLLLDGERPIRFFPAHPHEGAISAPPAAPHARVIATGVSKVSGRPFNLAVAFERAAGTDGRERGRAVAQSTFHHFADYNWDPRLGCPAFVSEPPGDGMSKSAAAAADIRAYVRNLAQWL